MEVFLALFGGLVLGTLHAFDADHIAAVTAFSSNQPESRKAAMLGVVWGMGHSATLFVFGLFAIAFRFVIPPLLESVAEAIIGVVLVGIGIWVLRGLFLRRHIHIHKHTHDGIEHTHFHSHNSDHHHRHHHSMFLVGAAHGLAGTASVLVIIPVALSESMFAAALYLLLFGLGTMTAMGIFAFVLGSVSRMARAQRFLPVLQGAAGSASIVVGLVWISGAIFP